MKIEINGIEFVEGIHSHFVIYGDENQIDFMESKPYIHSIRRDVKDKDGPIYEARIYKSLWFEGKYYIPKLSNYQKQGGQDE